MKKQKGSVMILSLIILAILSILVASSMRSITTEQKITTSRVLSVYVKSILEAALLEADKISYEKMKNMSGEEDCTSYKNKNRNQNNIAYQYTGFCLISFDNEVDNKRSRTKDNEQAYKNILFVNPVFDSDMQRGIDNYAPWDFSNSGNGWFGYDKIQTMKDIPSSRKLFNQFQVRRMHYDLGTVGSSAINSNDSQVGNGFHNILNTVHVEQKKAMKGREKISSIAQSTVLVYRNASTQLGSEK